MSKETYSHYHTSEPETAPKIFTALPSSLVSERVACEHTCLCVCVCVCVCACVCACVRKNTDTHTLGLTLSLLGREKKIGEKKMRGEKWYCADGLGPKTISSTKYRKENKKTDRQSHIDCEKQTIICSRPSVAAQTDGLQIRLNPKP